MRCALSFDENKMLIEQKVAAWGEMQSLRDDPSYKEEDIKGEMEASFFRGVKHAMDSVCNILDCLEDNGMISEEVFEEVQQMMAEEIAMQLFSILDYQDDE